MTFRERERERERKRKREREKERERKQKQKTFTMIWGFCCIPIMFWKISDVPAFVNSVAVNVLDSWLSRKTCLLPALSLRELLVRCCTGLITLTTTTPLCSTPLTLTPFFSTQMQKCRYINAHTCTYVHTYIHTHTHVLLPPSPHTPTHPHSQTFVFPVFMIDLLFLCSRKQNKNWSNRQLKFTQYDKLGLIR